MKSTAELEAQLVVLAEYGISVDDLEIELMLPMGFIAEWRRGVEPDGSKMLLNAIRALRGTLDVMHGKRGPDVGALFVGKP